MNTTKSYVIRVSKEAHEKLLQMAVEQRRTVKTVLDIVLEVNHVA